MNPVKKWACILLALFGIAVVVSSYVATNGEDPRGWMLLEVPDAR